MSSAAMVNKGQQVPSAGESTEQGLEGQQRTEQQDKSAERAVMERQQENSADKGQQGSSLGDNREFQEEMQGPAVVVVEQQGSVEGDGLRAAGEKAKEISTGPGRNEKWPRVERMVAGLNRGPRDMMGRMLQVAEKGATLEFIVEW